MQIAAPFAPYIFVSYLKNIYYILLNCFIMFIYADRISLWYFRCVNNILYEFYNKSFKCKFHIYIS